MDSQHRFRNNLIEELRIELVGPDPTMGGQNEILNESPRQRYSAGVLFPPKEPLIELEDGADDEDDPGRSDIVAGETQPDEIEDRDIAITGREESPDSIYDETISLANSYLPSAMGLTFVCQFPTKGLSVTPHAARYVSRPPRDPKTKLREWHRQELELPPKVFGFSPSDTRHMKEASYDDGNLKLRVFARKRSNGDLLVTISLVNSRVHIPSKSAPQAPPSDCYFQVGFEVTASSGDAIFQEYRVESLAHQDDPEEHSLSLQFRNRHAFAVGHGCAPEWEADRNCARMVRTESLPSFKLPPVEPRADGGIELSMYALSGLDKSTPAASIPDILESLPNDYEKWLSERTKELGRLGIEHRKTAEHHLATCKSALGRIQAGIGVLKTDGRALDAFMRANQAILMQQLHYKRPLREQTDDWEPLPASYKPSNSYLGRWRTFQIAFILLNIPSMVKKDDGSYSSERDIVDLIWFPTGGGKTEAYLGLSAFTIFYRRLVEPSNAGCTILMRYTLRLLTAQQFQRASAMICACEVIRAESPERYGTDRIDIGLWVGNSLTPNRRSEALQALKSLGKKNSDAENKFQLLKCPWCGTALDRGSILGYRVRATQPKSVVFVCPEKRCYFSSSQKTLPVCVIDEDIYETPPTLLIGTADKFAMLAWRPEAGAIFGLGPSLKHSPPDLIIQDELHLISGPLGSMVGLYESVIDQLCTRESSRPKIVASTATIRRADAQCKALYNRNICQFPPPGIDVSDSFFAKENTDAIGRIYVGVLPTASPSFVTALKTVSAALLQSVKAMPLPDGATEHTRDAYWTQVQYFNSLRELGRAATLVQQDIPEHMWAIASRRHIKRELCRTNPHFEELTSRKTAEEIPQILSDLENSYPREGRDAPYPIDVLLATNMISVGVDVDRLGLMCVVGQPKTTSEYIQASSRVGRSSKAPGLVVTLYNPGKPRDRSHFERFREYHSSLYRFVEPTSVTPFSIPVIDRALHALVVIAARLFANTADPQHFSPGDSGMKAFSEALIQRVQDIDQEHASLVASRLKELTKHWQDTNPRVWGSFGKPPEDRPLMYPSGSIERDEWDGAPWPTPASMRNVDQECEGEILSTYPGAE